MNKQNPIDLESLNLTVKSLALNGTTEQIGVLPVFVTTGYIGAYEFKYLQDLDEAKESFSIRKDNSINMNDAGEEETLIYHCSKKHDKFHVLIMLNEVDYAKVMKIAQDSHKD